MADYYVSLFLSFFRIGTVSMLLIYSVQLIRLRKSSLTAVFFTFCLTSLLLSELYWMIYYFMRPDTRMPFAANEIGEAAYLLLGTAVLVSAVPTWSGAARMQAAGALLFAACNTALWIAWSGEWPDDIFIGAAFAYFLYHVACGCKEKDVLTAGEWLFVGIGCVVLILGQVSVFLVPAEIKQTVDTCCYLIMTGILIFWAGKNALALQKRAESKACLCLSCALLGWSITSMYMSEGAWYNLFLITEIVSMILIYMAVRRVVTEA